MAAALNGFSAIVSLNPFNGIESVPQVVWADENLHVLNPFNGIERQLEPHPGRWTVGVAESIQWN